MRFPYRSDTLSVQNLRNLLPVASPNNKQSSGFASQQAQEVRKHKDVRVLRKVTDGVRKTRGVWGVVPPQTREHAQPNLSASAVRSQPAQAQLKLMRTTVFMHHANPKEIPECDYFLTTLARGENISFENDGLRGGVR